MVLFSSLTLYRKQNSGYGISGHHIEQEKYSFKLKSTAVKPLLHLKIKDIPLKRQEVPFSEEKGRQFSSTGQCNIKYVKT